MQPVRQAVILAAGASTRTHPLTVDRPKPLLPILNRPLLAQTLTQLEGLVEEVILVVGFRHEMIRAAFGTRFGSLRLRYVEQREPLGTGHALLQALPLLEGRFLVLNGDDLVARDDLEALTAYPQALLTTVMDDPRAFSIVELDAGGRVVRIIEKPTDPPPSAQTSIGFYLMGPEAAEAVRAIRPSPRGEYELTDVAAAMTAAHRFQAVPVRGYWLPIGYPWKLLEATCFLLDREPPPLPALPGVEIEGPVLLGEDVVVGRGARLGPCTVLGDGVRIGAGAVVRESLLMAGVTVGARARIEASVLAEGVLVGEDARFLPCEPPCTAPVRSRVKGRWVTTGLRRFGAVIGAGARVGRGATLYPGVKLWPRLLLPDGATVRDDLPSNEEVTG